MEDIRAVVAIRIREFDPDGTLHADELGKSLGIVLAPHFTDLYAEEVQRFVTVVDPGRRMTAPDLADAIVQHFRLDEGN